MPKLSKLLQPIQPQKNLRQPIYFLSFTILFVTLFDCTMSYITPLLLVERGFSITLMGIIVGVSSFAGAIFDLILCKIAPNANYRRIFLAMFAASFIYPLILWSAKSIWIFLLAMAIWGIYYDLLNFGIFNFIGRYTQKEENANNFGITQVFKALANVIAPIVVGFAVVAYVDWKSFALGWIFLAIGLLFFISLILLMKRQKVPEMKNYLKPKTISFEVHLWKKIGRLILPVLLLTFFLYLIEAFFWTLMPIYAESSGLKVLAGLFLTAYTLPALFVGWLIGSITRKFGKKRTGYLGLFIGSIVLSTFSLINGPYLIALIIFVASFFIAFSLPSINSAYADYISETPEVEKEIESLEDFFTNLGFILGPITAGFLADSFSIPTAFTFLGLAGTLLAIILFNITPRSISIKLNNHEIDHIKG